MRFKFTKIFFLLFLLVLLFTACSGECRHRKMSEKIVPPSCGERGYTVFTCIDCSFSFESDFVSPSPHTLTSSIVAPTCTSAGYTLNECSKCDYNYISDATSIIPHTINLTVIAPTCTSPGYTISECSICDYKSTSEHTAPLSHDIKEIKVLPTCEQEGYTTFSCKTCSFSYTVDHVSASAHIFSSTVTKPSCTKQGYTTKVCSVCEKSIISDYTAPKGHSYAKSKIRATSSRDGYTLNDCLDCDYSYKSDFEYSYAIFSGAYANSNTPLAKGIDVSSYNESLNWSTLARNGVDFAIIRAGSSKTGEDLFFDINYDKARAAGINLGAYYYVEASSVEEILEYANTLEAILGSRKFEYPIYLDIEKLELGETLGKDLLTEMCSAFIEKLQANGYFAAIYTNNNWLENYYDRYTITKKYDIWYARYISDDKLSSPEWDLTRYGTTMGIWQYTDNGTISGFNTPFDLNIAYKDYPTIIKRYHYNGY